MFEWLWPLECSRVMQVYLLKLCYHVPALCLGINLISIHHVIRPAFTKPLNLSYSPEQASHWWASRGRQHVDNEKQWERHKQQMKNLTAFPRMHLFERSSWMETGVCERLCGGSWRFWPVWFVYCIGDLGQWSTSGTSHNRAHTSTALRHPTRRLGREWGEGKETSGFFLPLPLWDLGSCAF